MDFENNIKEVIEYHIQKSGRTKKDVAKSAGLHSGSFNKMLNNPTYKTIYMIAKALGIKPYQLLQKEENTLVINSVYINGIEYVPNESEVDSEER